MPYGYTSTFGGPSFGGPSSFGNPYSGPVGPQNATGGGGIDWGKWAGIAAPFMIGWLNTYQGTQANNINKQQLAQNAQMSQAALAEQKRQFDVENGYRTNPQYASYLTELAKRFGAPSIGVPSVGRVAPPAASPAPPPATLDGWKRVR